MLLLLLCERWVRAPSSELRGSLPRALRVRFVAAASPKHRGRGRAVTLPDVGGVRCPASANGQVSAHCTDVGHGGSRWARKGTPCPPVLGGDGGRLKTHTLTRTSVTRDVWAQRAAAGRSGELLADGPAGTAGGRHRRARGCGAPRRPRRHPPAGRLRGEITRPS